MQSKSFDEVAAVSKQAGDMASCIPAIPPIVPDASKYNFSSPFGYRTDPFTGEARLHSGVDLAMKVGNPVYATGDAVVEAVNFDFFGYGNTIILNHGFGYQTLYAHLNSVNVIEGMKVKRGDCIAETGQSGRASGHQFHKYRLRMPRGRETPAMVAGARTAAVRRARDGPSFWRGRLDRGRIPQNAPQGTCMDVASGENTERTDMKPLSEIIGEVESRISAACAASGRTRGDVRIVAVTKTHRCRRRNGKSRSALPARSGI